MAPSVFRIMGRAMRILQTVLAFAFLGWCVYGGVYLPAQYGAYDNGSEAPADSNGYSDNYSVGEDNVGEDLSSD